MTPEAGGTLEAGSPSVSTGIGSVQARTTATGRRTRRRGLRMFFLAIRARPSGCRPPRGRDLRSELVREEAHDPAADDLAEGVLTVLVVEQVERDAAHLGLVAEEPVADAGVEQLVRVEVE